MIENWHSEKLKNCLAPFQLGTKIPKKKYLSSGRFPIISQEDEHISGYWNHSDDLTKVDKPVVVYGDHTQTTKFVTSDFVAGADGIKVLLPKDFLDTKYY